MSNEQPPPGQPQPRNPLRAALERFGRERGQPANEAVLIVPGEPCAICGVRRGYHDGLSHSWSQERGQPQQEPARTGHHKFRPDDLGYCRLCGLPPGDSLHTQERQAGGGHVHERGSYINAGSDSDLRCQKCGMIQNLDWWRIYERGVADAAAQAKEQ